MVKKQSKINFGFNDKVYLDLINGEEFLALTTRKAELRVLNGALALL